MGRMNRLSFRAAKSAVERFSPKMAAVSAFGIACGCRITEIITLKCGDVFTPEGTIRNPVRFPKLKTRKGRFGKKTHYVADWRDMPVPEAWQGYIVRYWKNEVARGYGGADEWLFRGKNGKHADYRTIYDYFRNRLGAGHGTHWMRKTFAYEMYEFYKSKGYDTLNAAKLVQKLLGHTRLDTTIRYLGFEEEQLGNDLAAVFNRKEE